MVPDREYFAVQRKFAERWAALAPVPIETAYLECTTWCVLTLEPAIEFIAADASCRARFLCSGRISAPPPA